MMRAACGRICECCEREDNDIGDGGSAQPHLASENTTVLHLDT